MSSPIRPSRNCVIVSMLAKLTPRRALAGSTR